MTAVPSTDLSVKDDALGSHKTLWQAVRPK